MRNRLPKRGLRGLRKADQVDLDDEGSVWVLTSAFEPSWPSRDDRVTKRDKSNHYESSVNWEDHSVESFKVLSEDTSNAKYGILSFRLADLKKAKKQYPRFVDWEREPIKGNRFHGNILFGGTLSRPRCRQIAAEVANCVQSRIRFTAPTDYESELVRRTELMAKNGTLWQRAQAWVRARLGIE
jgi:hypothetical protein